MYEKEEKMCDVKKIKVCEKNVALTNDQDQPPHSDFFRFMMNKREKKFDDDDN